MIENFINYIQLEKRYSNHTVSSYKKDLEDFINFCLKSESTNQINTIDKKVIRNFIIELSSNSISKRSINRKLSTLRSYYLFLLKLGEIDVSPMESVSSLKFYPEKQIPMSVEEMELVQQKIFENSDGVLESLIIEILYQTGIRKAELCNLMLEQVDLEKKEIKVFGKGNKQRIVPLSEELCNKISAYVIERNPANSDHAQYLLLTPSGKKLYEKFVYSVVNRYLSFATTKSKKSPHILRHSFATHVLNNGAEISKVKKIMGHSSLASTQVYTNANIEQLKKVFYSAHPRALKDNNEDVK